MGNLHQQRWNIILVYISRSFWMFQSWKKMVLTLPIKFSIRHTLYKAAVSFTQLLYIFGILQTGRNWHFLVWVLTHCQEYWSTSVWPHRWISLFIFQIRLTIMDGGQWPKKIITYQLTQAPAYTYSSITSWQTGVWKRGHAKAQAPSPSTPHVKSAKSPSSHPSTPIWDSLGNVDKIECSIVSANAV